MKSVDAKTKTDALKLLQTLVEPCKGADNHSWRKCRRCLAVHGIENRFNLTMRLLQAAIDLLKDTAGPIASPSPSTTSTDES